MATKFLKEGQDFEYPASFGFSGSSKGSVNPLPHPTQDGDEFGDGTYLAQQSANPPTFARGGHVTPHHKPPHVAPKAAKAVVGALQLGEQIGEKKAAMAPPSPAGAPPMGAPVIRQGPIPPQMMNCGGPVMRAQGGPADAKPKMNFDGGDHQYDSSAEGAKELAAPAFADGGSVSPPRPTPRPFRGPVRETGIDAPAARTPDSVLWNYYQDEKSGFTKNGVVQHPTPAEKAEDGHAKGGFIKGAIKKPGRETKRAKAAGRSVHEQMEHDKGSKDPSLRGAANLGLRLTGGDLKPKKG